MTSKSTSNQYSMCMLKDEHIDSCVKIYMDAYSKEPWCEQYTYDSVYKYIRKQLEISNFIGCVLTSNDEIVGQVLGYIMPTAIGDYLRIEDFCISPRYQNIGAGSAFMSMLCEHLKSLGLDTIVLNTVRTFPSYSFYKKNGFHDLEDSATLFLKI